MNTKKIEVELRLLFIEAMKLESNIARHQLDWVEWRSRDQTEGPPDWLIEKGDTLVKPFEYLAFSLYLTTVCYLDANNLNAYLNQFYLKFGEKFDSNKAATQFDIDNLWLGEPYNVFLTDLKQFLQPFDILGGKDIYLSLSGVQYLETVLRNTSAIIYKTGQSPKSETDVYKAVRSVLEAIFASAKSPKSNFFKTAQEYKPDILIPELSVAVEYKYAEDESKLKACIGQISDDVKGYSGDNDYNLFYAVFYVTNDFWGVDKFNFAWEEKNFPKNWRAFYIVGNKTL